MNTNDIGLIGETKIIHEAVKKGYSVSIPQGGFSPYDMIVDRKGKLEKVQVKTVRSDTNVISVCTSTTKTHINGKKKSVNYSITDFEWLAVYDITTDNCFYIPSNEMVGANLKLRLVPTKNHQKQGIRWAKDYLDW